METPILRDLCELIVDCEHKTAPLNPTGYPSIRTPNVGRGRLILDDVNRVSERTYRAWTRRATPIEGDLILAREAPVGNVAIIPKGLEVCLGQRTVLIRPNPAMVEPSYLLYLLLSRGIQAKFQSLTAGATVPHLNMADIRSLELPHMPPRDVQRKISSVLSNYDDLIEDNTRRVGILEEMCRTIYYRWFVNHEFPGQEYAKRVDSELGPIPAGWEVRKLSDLVETQYGYTESSNSKNVGPKYLRGKDINKTTYIDWDSVPYCQIDVEDHKKYKLNPGDVLVVRMADPGKVGIVEKVTDAVFASYLIRLNLRASSLLSPYFLFYFLLSDRYQGFVSGASTGTTRKSASAGIITDIDMVVPSTTVIAEFEGYIGGIRRLLNNLLDRNVNLRFTRDLLLSKLIPDEVDNPDPEAETLDA